MTSKEFRMWIKGYIELSDEAELTPQQLRIIRNHATVVRVVGKQLDPGIMKFMSALNTDKSAHISQKDFKILTDELLIDL